MLVGAILTAVAFVICLLMVPGTKGKSLEEVSTLAPQAPVLVALRL
jgi:putative MFS transporter